MKKTATWLAALCAALLALPVMGCKDELNSVAVESVTLNTTTLTLAPGETGKLTATVLPDNADDKTMKWSSSNTDVVMVDSNGTVGAISVGIATITAQAGGKTAVCEVTVNEVTVNPESTVVEKIMLSTTTLTIEPGKTRKLTATVTPSNADDKTVTWSSSDKNIATISDDGTVTAHAEGTATITAKAGDKTATCAVTVKPILITVKSVMLNMTALTLTRGEIDRLVATVTPDNADDKTVAWSSSNSDVATVVDGTVTAVKVGMATITAQAGDISAECTVIVNPILVESVALDKTTLTLAPGMTGKLTATLKPNNADDKNVKWSSSNTSVAMVDNDGTIGAIKTGETTITAEVGEITAKCMVTVHTDHSFSGGKCTLCGARPYMENGTITENGVLWEYNGSETAVIIPDGVTGIALYAFRDCTNLVSVVIPSSVMEIGYGAFYGCTSLTSVQIPDSVTSIHSSVFNGCTSLKSVTIPDGVTSIGGYMFSGCTSLTNMTIPASITSIENYAFQGVENLTEIQFGGTKAQWKAIEGNYNSRVPVICVFCSDGHIGVKEVPAYLKMYGMEVIGYTDGIPSNLVIPDGVASIGGSAFQGCTSLESVMIPSSVTDINGFVYNEGAFRDCTNLKTVTICEGVTRIGGNAFWGCTSLASITIPSSVMYISGHAFYESGLTSVVLSEGLKFIDGCAFQLCKNLTSVSIPSSVTDIELLAFNACTSLKSVVMTEGLTRIGKSTFAGCTSLTSVKIPKSVTNIEESAFRDCQALTDVVIPESVTSIKKNTFEICYSLESVTIPGSVTSIGEGSFFGCRNLKSVMIPEGVTSIDETAFALCKGLKNVTIPNSVTSINVGAFRDCGLNSVNYDGMKADWDKIYIDAESGLSGKTITGIDGSTWIAE